MTYMDFTSHSGRPLVPGQAFDVINRIFGSLGQVRRAEGVESGGYSTISAQTPQERNLAEIQDCISKISMHLPKGFSSGLNRQFANLLDEDAWEEQDHFIGSKALRAFTQLLLTSRTQRRPGIGTDGRGSITASWSVGSNRLVVECLPSEKVTIVLSREMEGGEVERAAFGPMNPRRSREVLAPFYPEVWFDVKR